MLVILVTARFDADFTDDACLPQLPMKATGRTINLKVFNLGFFELLCLTIGTET